MSSVITTSLEPKDVFIVRSAAATLNMSVMEFVAYASVDTARAVIDDFKKQGRPTAEPRRVRRTAAAMAKARAEGRA